MYYSTDHKWIKEKKYFQKGTNLINDEIIDWDAKVYHFLAFHQTCNVYYSKPRTQG